MTARHCTAQEAVSYCSTERRHKLGDGHTLEPSYHFELTSLKVDLLMQGGKTTRRRVSPEGKTAMRSLGCMVVDEGFDTSIFTAGPQTMGVLRHWFAELERLYEIDMDRLREEMMEEQRKMQDQSALEDLIGVLWDAYVKRPKGAETIQVRANCPSATARESVGNIHIRLVTEEANMQTYEVGVDFATQCVMEQSRAGLRKRGDLGPCPNCTCISRSSQHNCDLHVKRK